MSPALIGTIFFIKKAYQLGRISVVFLAVFVFENLTKNRKTYKLGVLIKAYQLVLYTN